MSKIALCMIVKATKEEAKLLNQCLASVGKQVDGIFILLNHKVGATAHKDAIKVCEKYGVDYAVTEWNGIFGQMRNQSLDRIPKEYDWVLWLDVDDTLETLPGVDLHELVEKVSKRTDGIEAVYNYDRDANGNIIEQLKLVRLFRNNGAFRWLDHVRIHETPMTTRSAGAVATEDFWVEHHTNGDRRERSLERNITILEEQLEDEIANGGADARTLFYLGSTYADVGRFDEAKEILETYVKVSGWDEERADAYCWLGRIEAKQARYTEAKQYYAKALAEYPKTKDAYIGLGGAELMLKQYDKAVTWLELSLFVKPSKSSRTQTPFDNVYRPYIMLAQCNMELGGNRLEIALKWAQKANEIAGDELSSSMIEQLKYLIQLGEQSTRFITLGRRMSKRPLEVEKLYQKLPEDVQKNPIVLGFMYSIRKPNKWAKKSVVIYCGSGPLKGWTPKSLDTGIGGSEEAVIRVSKHLTDLGYKVTVFAEPLADDGVYEGVAYKNYWEINFKDQFDVFIAWRSPFVYDIDVKARKKYLWIHDIMEAGEFTPERLANLDKVMLLSQYHRDLYPMIPDEKVFLTGNGIDEKDFEKLDNTVTRDPHRIIYASSHVRGLENLYNMWPDIKTAVPDASLYVYYGWDSFDNVTAGNPERAAWKEKMVKLANDLPDVHDEGRIGQDDIVRHTFESGIWAYPCFDFEEIYCITAVKAQAAGAYPVTTDRAALDENVKFGIKIPSKNYGEKELKQYKQALIDALNNTDKQDEERQAMMDWARTNKSWLSVARDWDEEFGKTDM